MVFTLSEFWRISIVLWLAYPTKVTVKSNHVCEQKFVINPMHRLFNSIWHFDFKCFTGKKNFTTIKCWKRAWRANRYIIHHNEMERFFSERKQIMLNVNINWMQITADKALNFNAEYMLHFLPFYTQRNLILPDP